jgi:hypothetical protein
MYDLFSQKIIFPILIFCFLSSSLIGQGGKDNYYFKNYNRKSYYFGINLGFNNSGYKLQQSSVFIKNDSVRITEGASDIGLNINMITNLKLGDYFDFRFMPGLSFAPRGIEYTQVESSVIVKRTIESVYFEMPFQVRFKSQPYRDKRAFVTAGLKYGYDVQSNSKSRKSQIRMAPHDFQYEMGLGIQMFYPYFIFSPEIKFSRGLGNLLIYDKGLNESRVLENVTSQIFTLSFNFEG